MLKTVIAQKIKEIRTQKKLSQRYLAGILGCNNGFICQVEKGKSFYNLEHIEKICAALDYPVAKLFEDDVCLREEPATPTTSQEKVLLEIYKGLSSDHKLDVIGFAGERRLAEVIPPRASKKAKAAA